MQGSSTDEKMINERPRIIKEPKVINKWWTAISSTYNINDISMVNKVPEMELQNQFSISGSEAASMFIYVLAIEVTEDVKCKLVMCCQQSDNSNRLDYCENSIRVIHFLDHFQITQFSSANFDMEFTHTVLVQT